MNTRKQKLETRANRYGKRAIPFGPEWAHFATGYEDGYKAAMRDLRKLVRAVNAEVPEGDGSFKRAVEVVRQRHVHTSIMVRRWLRPLR